MMTLRWPCGECQIRVREPAGDPLEVGEHAIAPLLVQRRQGTRENGVVVHSQGSVRARH